MRTCFAESARDGAASVIMAGSASCSWSKLSFTVVGALMVAGSSALAPARLHRRLVPATVPPRCARPLAAELDPNYRFVCRCEGAASELLPRYTPKPGIANYVTINVTSNTFVGPPPASIFELGARQFGRNLRAIFGRYDEAAGPLSPEVKANRDKLRRLRLSTANILRREEARGGLWLGLRVRVRVRVGAMVSVRARVRVRVRVRVSWP